LGTSPRVWYIPGYGQEYGRYLEDHRHPTPARNWQELRAAGKSPGGTDEKASHEEKEGGS
jgi:hypothetical protein